MKKILATIAAALVVVGCTTTQTLTPEKQAIDRVFAADASFAKNSTSVAQLVIKEKTISLAGCPADFIAAYKSNISAWEKMEAIEKKMYAANQENAARDIKAFLASYASDAPKAFVEMKSKWPQFAEELDKAFEDIERTKAAYKTVGAKYSSVYPSSGGLF